MPYWYNFDLTKKNVYIFQLEDSLHPFDTGASDPKVERPSTSSKKSATTSVQEKKSENKVCKVYYFHEKIKVYGLHHLISSTTTGTDCDKKFYKKARVYTSSYNIYNYFTGMISVIADDLRAFSREKNNNKLLLLFSFFLGGVNKQLHMFNKWLRWIVPNWTEFELEKKNQDLLTFLLRLVNMVCN